MAEMVMFCMLVAGCLGVAMAAAIAMSAAPPALVQAQQYRQRHTADVSHFWHAFQSEALQELARAPQLAPPVISRPDPQSVIPPLCLYHGTSRRNLASIYARGIEGRSGGWAFTARDSETARTYGRKWGGDYVILRVMAQQAYQGGVSFEDRSGYFVARHVHPAYLDFHWTLAELAARHDAAA